MIRNRLALASLSLTLLVTACGGSTQSQSTRGTSSAPAPAAPRPVAPRHIRLLVPRPGAHTGSTLTVHAVLLDGRHRVPAVLRYVLDGGPARPGSGRLRLRGLAAGRHRLLVTLAGDAAVRTTVSFFVRRPRPAAAAAPPAAPAPVTTTTTTATAPPPATTPAAPPPPTTTAPPPPTSSTTAAPPSRIPQHNGGDGDSDNNGAPSDGDGNL